jgi:hypothetical protein
MAKYLIEVPHEEETVACARVVKIFLETGSHYLTHAEWGCCDGDHRAWMIVDAESREEARAIVPPPIRDEARVVKLNRFTIDEIDKILSHHKG